VTTGSGTEGVEAEAGASVNGTSRSARVGQDATARWEYRFSDAGTGPGAMTG
jgi:hypothetical protein